MKLFPKQIIFIAVAKYLSDEELSSLINEYRDYVRLTGPRFIQITKKYFDFERLRLAPIIAEDIWIYNYLMYETKRREDSKITDIGNVLDPVGTLPNTPLIKQYASKVVKPNLQKYKDEGLILRILYS